MHRTLHSLLPAQQTVKVWDVPYVPTPDDVVASMLKLAGIHKGDVAYDLGCRDGRIVITAARLGARGVGVDINPDQIRDAHLEHAWCHSPSIWGDWKPEKIEEVDNRPVYFWAIPAR